MTVCVCVRRRTVPLYSAPVLLAGLVNWIRRLTPDRLSGEKETHFNLCAWRPCRNRTQKVAKTGSSEVKVSAWNVGDLGSIPGSGRSPGEGNGTLLQYSCLENPMDGGAWLATVHGVAKSQTRLSNFTFFNNKFVRN